MYHKSKWYIAESIFCPTPSDAVLYTHNNRVTSWKEKYFWSLIFARGLKVKLLFNFSVKHVPLL